ncbi:uncharacterized protein LOC135469130 [Liolophura sinensis]|uniref:uncharacterized protein LOC135469130 n=1 Tax=Liolophura sinensis TaxID=3198878 RepID=UPI00315967BA
MERQDDANGDQESCPTNENLSTGVVSVHNSGASARSVTDRNLLSRSLSFKLRHRPSRQCSKTLPLEGSPENLFRQWSGTMTFPKAKHSEEETLPSIKSTTISCPLPNRSPSSRPQTAIDWDAISDVVANDATCHKAAMDAVQYKNVGGIFVHTDKYAAGRFTKHFNHSPPPSEETLIITPDGASHRADYAVKRTRHVAWGLKTDMDTPGKDGQNRKVGFVTPASHTVRGESNCLTKPRFISSKNKVDHINVSWKMSQADGLKGSAKHERRPGRLCKSVLPVTIGVDYRGTSVSKTKWLVPTLPTHDPSQVWFKCLNFVKQRKTMW